MAKVDYRHGTKQTYLGLTERLDTALYFCTDTRELFKGDDLYSAGLRMVSGYEALPEYTVAADGILYLCEDSGEGYVLSDSRDSWVQVIYGVDDDTVHINTDGLIAVKAVKLTQVTGLADELNGIKELINESKAPTASADTAGIVKIGEEFGISDDGTISLKAIPVNKVTGLEEKLSSLEKEIAEKVTVTDASQIKFDGENLDKVLSELYTSIVWNDMDA